MTTPQSFTYNMDCAEYMKDVPDDFFDLCIADPPYRNLSDNAPQKEMRKNGDISKFGDKPSLSTLNELKRVSKEIIIFGANNFLIEFKGFIAWDKMIRGSERYSQIEIASLSEGLSTTSRLCRIDCHEKDKIHPTQKPLSLYLWVLDNYAKGVKKIYDPYMGSGNLRIACFMRGYDYYGCEINDCYFKKANERFRMKCFGEMKQHDGNIVKQLNLFE